MKDVCVGEKSQDVRRFCMIHKVIKVLIGSIHKQTKKKRVFSRITTKGMLKECIINKLMEKWNNKKYKKII